MVDISMLSKLELKELLKKIKLLDSLKRSLGKRGFSEYNRITYGKNSYRVEYYDFGETSLSYVKGLSVDLFNKLFGIKVLDNDIEFISNKHLAGGIRIFLNDNMFNLSYSRFEKLLK